MLLCGGRNARILAACALLAALASISRVDAARAGSPETSGERTSLIAAENAHDAKPFLAGLRMELQPGWHTYWRMPGDSGIAPHFDWSHSVNAAAIELLWPAPERFDASGDNTIGYTREVVWPVLVRAADPAKPVTLDVAMTYGVCSNICVPGEAHLSLTLPPSKTPEETPDASRIRYYLVRVPVAPTDQEAVSVSFTDAHLHVRLVRGEGTPSLIVEGPPNAWFGVPTSVRTGKAILYDVPVELDPGTSLKNTEVTLTFVGPETAIEVKRKID